jgi:hypothetical protein
MGLATHPEVLCLVVIFLGILIGLLKYVEVLLCGIDFLLTQLHDFLFARPHVGGWRKKRSDPGRWRAGGSF